MHLYALSNETSNFESALPITTIVNGVSSEMIIRMLMSSSYDRYA